MAKLNANAKPDGTETARPALSPRSPAKLTTNTETRSNSATKTAFATTAKKNAPPHILPNAPWASSAKMTKKTGIMIAKNATQVSDNSNF